MAVSLPIRTLVRPSVLEGQSNGRLDPGILKTTPGNDWRTVFIWPSGSGYGQLLWYIGPTIGGMGTAGP